MSLYRFQLAYRFRDGTVGGFVAGKDGPNGNNAKMACIDQARNACGIRNEIFDNTRLILNKKGVSPEEMKIIEADWKAGRGKGILATKKDLLS